MKLVLSILMFTGYGAFAAQPLIELENQMQQRVNAIIQRADPVAIVQVQIKPRKISADLPMFGMTAQVTPMNFDGQISASTVENVKIRVISQLETVPDWIKSEILRATEVNGVKVEVSYEKAAGQLTDDRAELAKVAKEISESAMHSLNEVKMGVWGIMGAIIFCLLAVAWAVFSMAKRMETSLGRVVEEKVVPAMQTAGGGGARPVEKEQRSEENRPAAMAAAATNAGVKELAEFPKELVSALFNDCYWTGADGYANYLWQQCTQAQKRELLASPPVDPNYFAYIRQAAPENLEYHNDPRYLDCGTDFAHVNQDELAAYVTKNPKSFTRVTPLRWDRLPLSLEQRLQFSEMSDVKAEAVKVTAKSKPRELKARLEIKQLRAEDEQFIWENHAKVPAHARASLRSLVWLALAPLEERRKVLSDLDARQLSDAWTGPAAVLSALQEALPAKKLEMLEHFLKEASPGRSNDTFAYLVESGLRLYVDPNSTQVEAA